MLEEMCVWTERCVHHFRTRIEIVQHCNQVDVLYYQAQLAIIAALGSII